MFKRLDLFVARCEDLLHTCTTAQQFERLPNVVIGGITGGVLTRDIEAIDAEFVAAYEKVKTVVYDVLDVEVAAFDADIVAFSHSVKALETRLAKTLTFAFDDCGTLTSCFKLVDIFGELLERDFVQADLEAKHLELVRGFSTELKAVQVRPPNPAQETPPPQPKSFMILHGHPWSSMIPSP
jgi:dynein heavy chain